MILISEQLPTKEDADENGLIEWFRSGVWVRGSISNDVPVDATAWRHIDERMPPYYSWEGVKDATNFLYIAAFFYTDNDHPDPVGAIYNNQLPRAIIDVLAHYNVFPEKTVTQQSKMWYVKTAYLQLMKEGKIG